LSVEFATHTAASFCITQAEATNCYQCYGLVPKRQLKHCCCTACNPFDLVTKFTTVSKPDEIPEAVVHGFQSDVKLRETTTHPKFVRVFKVTQHSLWSEKIAWKKNLVFQTKPGLIKVVNGDGIPWLTLL